MISVACLIGQVIECLPPVSKSDSTGIQLVFLAMMVGLG